MATLTQQRVRVDSPFPFIELTSLHIRQVESEHARAEFSGVLDEDVGMDALRQQLEGQLVRFYDEQAEMTIFAGYIQDVEVSEENGYYMLSAMALSGSILLDQAKRKRSYQDVTLLYEDVLSLALDDVETSDFILRVEDKPIGIPLVQYDETGWEFAMRLASHFNTTITPEMETGLPRFWIGLRVATGALYEFSDCEYRAVFEKKYYKVGGSQLGFSREQFLSYTVKSYENCPLGAKANFQGKQLRICRKFCTFEGGLLTYTYTLGRPELLERQKYFNEKLIGLSLLGNVIATQGGTVKLHLNIDEKQDIGTAYPYRWAPPTGNYMYLLPKIGSEVSLYFSDPGEDSAKATNCIRTEFSRQSPGMADTHKRGLSTEFKKNMLIYPDKFGFESRSSDDPLQFMFSDDDGVTLETVHAITVIGGGNVTLEAPIIEMSSPTQVGAFYTGGQELTENHLPPTSLTVYQSGSMSIAESGQNVVVGQERWELEAFTDDIPEEGQFDWGGLLNNIVAGLAVVACVVLVAATFGAAAPILIGAAIAGAAAVGSMAVSDIMRGNVSSAEAYMREALISSVVGLVTGAIGQGVSSLKVVQTFGKVGKALSAIGADVLQGSAGSAINQLMRASMTGEQIDWGNFWKDVGISSLAGVASGATGRALNGSMSKLAGGILGKGSPGMKAAITAGIAGSSGAGTNYLMQLGDMVLHDENGNFNFNISRANNNNINWNSVINSGIVGMVQSLVTTGVENRQNKKALMLDEMPPLLVSNDPLVLPAPDEPLALPQHIELDDVAAGIGQSKVTPQGAPEAVDDNGIGRVSGANKVQLEVFENAKDNITTETNKRKGNFGEICTDLDVEIKGPVSNPNSTAHRVGVDRITDIDAKGHKGIDGIYKCDSPPPDYVVVEAKYGTSQLSKTRSGIQMSDGWVTGNGRIDDYFGLTSEGAMTPEQMNFEISWVMGRVQKEISRVDANGNVKRTLYHSREDK